MRTLFIFLIVFILPLFAACNSDHKKGLIVANKAAKMTQDQEYTDAIPVFKVALKLLDPKSDNIGITYSNLGICFRQIDELDSSQYYYKKAFAFFKKNTFYHHTFKGEYLLSVLSVHEALNEFEKANALEKEINTLVNLASIYAGDFETEKEPTIAKLTNLNKAEQYLLQAKKIENTENVSSKLGEIYLQQLKFDQSAAIFKELYEKYPSKEIYRYNHGSALFYGSTNTESEGYSLMEEASKRDDDCKELFKLVQADTSENDTK